jgi:hypothetical protein
MKPRPAPFCKFCPVLRITTYWITAATGGGIIACSAQLHKDSQEKLAELLESLEALSKGCSSQLN